MIPVNEPLLNGNEKKYLNECIDTGWISSEGPFIKEFEEKMAAAAGRKYGVAVWSICGMADDKWPIAVDYTKRINAVQPVIKAKLTGLPNVGHSAWNQAYDPNWKTDSLNLYEWMLQYKRP